MKITLSQLRQIIKEEVQRSAYEARTSKSRGTKVLREIGEWASNVGSTYPFKVGDVVEPADGSNYEGEITHIDKTRGVRHKDLKTGVENETSYYGFLGRYMFKGEETTRNMRR